MLGVVAMASVTLELDVQTLQQLEALASASKQSVSEWLRQLVNGKSDNHTNDDLIDSGYRAMAQDKEREADAKAWCEGLILPL
jgi:predicted transcriptional regulator